MSINKNLLPVSIVLLSLVFWGIVIVSNNSSSQNTSSLTSVEPEAQKEQPRINIEPQLNTIEDKNIATEDSKKPLDETLKTSASINSSEQSVKDKEALALSAKKVKDNVPVNDFFAPLTPELSSGNADAKPTTTQKEASLPVWVQIKVTEQVVEDNNSNKVEDIVANIKKEEMSKLNQTVKASEPSKTNTIDKINDLTNKLMTLNSLTKNTQQVKEKSTIVQSDNKKYITAMNTEGKSIVEDKSKIDYYNRIQINDDKSKNSLQNKVYQLNNTSDSSSYVKSLKPESELRRNQIRSIRLKKGDSIWKVAVRAYGDGNKYILILEANPHITVGNARRLQPGALIRVPL